MFTPAMSKMNIIAEIVSTIGDYQVINSTTYQLTKSDGTTTTIWLPKSQNFAIKTVQQPDGSKTETVFNSDGTKTVKHTKDGFTEVIEYFSNGTKGATYSLNEKGNKCGLFEEFHANGKLKGFSYWSNGQQDGAFAEYTEEGVIREKGSFQNGRVEEFIEYNKKGKVVEHGWGGFSLGEGRMRRGYTVNYYGEHSYWDDNADYDYEYDSPGDDYSDYEDDCYPDECPETLENIDPLAYVEDIFWKDFRETYECYWNLRIPHKLKLRCRCEECLKKKLENEEYPLPLFDELPLSPMKDLSSHGKNLPKRW
jgi:hypothetical protein